MSTSAIHHHDFLNVDRHQSLRAQAEELLANGVKVTDKGDLVIAGNKLQDTDFSKLHLESDFTNACSDLVKKPVYEMKPTSDNRILRVIRGPEATERRRKKSKFRTVSPIHCGDMIVTLVYVVLADNCEPAIEYCDSDGLKRVSLKENSVAVFIGDSILHQLSQIQEGGTCVSYVANFSVNQKPPPLPFRIANAMTNSAQGTLRRIQAQKFAQVDYQAEDYVAFVLFSIMIALLLSIAILATVQAIVPPKKRMVRLTSSYRTPMNSRV